jgi:diguanylate cyclase (GGDEF)-like protein/PAS domain S-box-containing protein
MNSKLLREKAEMILKAQDSNPTDPIAAHEVQALLHELQVHQIELEMQNEELLRKHDELQEAKNLYFDLYELAPIGYVSLDKKGNILKTNITFSRLCDTPKSKLLKHPLTSFIFFDDQDLFYKYYQRLISTSDKDSCELRMIRGDGTFFWAQLDSSVSHSSDGDILLFFAISDVTLRKQTELDLKISAIAFESQNGIFITDNKGVMIKVNKAVTQITGYTAQELIGHNVSLLQSGRQDQEFYKIMWGELITKGHWKGIIYNKRKNTEIYTEQLVISAAHTEGLNVTHYVGNFTDITEEQNSRDIIQHLADYDPLTGLPNRRLLKDRIEQAITASTRNKMYGAVVFVDIDHFKLLNDTHGHNVGDLLLIEIGMRLCSNVRESDTVGRQGGDEFVILLHNLSSDINESVVMAKHLGEKLLKAMTMPFDLNGLEYNCKISMGITLLENSANVDELLQHADIALYQAKEAGRNRMRFFDPSMQEALNFQVALEAEINTALQHDELQLFYQPQIDDEKIIGVEALIRWQHPQRGLVAPNEFIPLCEINGMILPIGEWVLQTACAQLKKWEAHPSACCLHVAVNVSAKQFRQPDYVSLVKTAIDHHQINPTLLKLELTESIILDDIDDSILKMYELKALGITFSMDDFGTGYSSLAYLAKLPLDQLKIDKSFVDNIPGTKNDEMITRTIITIGIELEMNVIAEGVETRMQKDFLQANGCTTYQGYLFSRPLPIETLEELINAGK